MNTKTYDKIKKCIFDYVEEHEYAPSIREICEITEIKSTSTVQNYMKLLFLTGVLESEHEGCPRAFRISKGSKNGKSVGI